MNTKRLDGQLVLITGAGSGIGRETALLCARRGADLVLCDIDRTGVEQTALAARALCAEVMAERVDISDRADVEALADAVHARYDAVDLLINNAGVGLVGGFLDTTEEDWDRLVAINLMGVVHGCAAFTPAMVRRGRGHVVNLSSAAGFMANPALSAYTATKFAVLGLSEALRTELRPHGIGVTAICPGVINTPITRTSPIRGGDEGARREKLSRLYERRGYTPERVASKILRAVDRDRAVAPVTAEAHAMYALTRFAPGTARWISGRLAETTK
jgi:NAD(P)-dependent dehydrogenase (short-subunit alcohol dehydrogenase family)